MSEGINAAEQFVYWVCRQSFLSLWSYANPRGKGPGKELCDVLIVCDPDVIIVSVKDISLSKTEDLLVGWERWRRKAIEASARQIYGAERWLETATHVIRSDGSSGLPLPERNVRRVHRVAVALGSKGNAPIEFGDFGKGLVHVFDETSFQIILRELDTITDFVGYLSSKEKLLSSGVQLVLQGSEEDLLALYLHGGRQFPERHDVIVVGDSLWQTVLAKEEFQARKKADRESYIWDRIIEAWAEDILAGRLEFSSSLSGSEMAVRTIAREDRFHRRILGKGFKDFMDGSAQRKVRARMMTSPSGVAYVFLALPHGEDRQFRVAELGNRCFIARGHHRNCKTVVGIATEQYTPGKGFSLDLIWLHKEEWTADDQTSMEAMQRDLGFFVNPAIESAGEDEYPHPR